MAQENIHPEILHIQLITAIDTGDVKAIKLLLNQGADANAKVYNGDTISDKNPMISVKSNSYTPLLMYAWKQHSHLDFHRNILLQIIHMLIAHGADINAQDAGGNTLLYYVRDEEIGDLLIAYGADVNHRNERREPPLFHFIDNKKTASMLLKHGADVNAQDYEGNTVFHHLASQESYLTNDQLDLVKEILSYKPNINLKDYYGCTPLKTVINSSYYDSTYYEAKEFVTLLLAHGADSNIPDNTWGKTALHDAAYNGDAELVKLLLAYDAHVNAIDNHNKTPLHWAICSYYRLFEDKEKNNDYEKIITLLLAHGADVTMLDESIRMKFDHIND